MPKFMIEYSDYIKLIDIAKQSHNTPTNELNTIINKYSASKQINDIKVKLFNNVKKYSQGTEENKKAYDKYKTFKGFADNLREHINDENITLDMLVNAIKEQELELESKEIQVLH